MIDALMAFKSDIYGESLSFGDACLYALIGFMMVFIGIILIIFIIWLIGLLMRKTNNLAFLNKLGKKNKKQQPLPKAEEPILETDGDIPDEIKAAIVAAIMTYYCEQKPECEFKVRRIKRI